MSANPIAAFLTVLGQALAARALYADGHPVRIASRERVHQALMHALDLRGALRLSLLDGTVLSGARVLVEMRGWDWGPRLAAAGVQRIEIDPFPPPTQDDVAWLLEEIAQRLASGPDQGVVMAHGGMRLGPISVETDVSDEPRAIGDVLDAMAGRLMTEEASAVRWIHDEIASGRPVPMAEADTVVHSLAMAIRREQQIILPLLDIKTYDQYTTTHSCNVAMLSMGLAHELGLSPVDIRAIGTAALLHDIGKVRVPTEILVKPGALTPEEMNLMKSHTVEGARILSARARGHTLAIAVAYEHHLWENGVGGYPTVRWPRRCHYASRLVHICDLYDALSTRRPYRNAWPRARTIGMLQDQADIEVDREMLGAFVSLLERTEERRAVRHDLDVPRDGWSGDVARTAHQMKDAAPAHPPAAPAAA